MIKRIVTFVSLFSLISASFGVGMFPATAQPLEFDADVTIRFTGLIDFAGNPRTLIIKEGSNMTQLVVNATNMVITTTQNHPVTIWDTGRTRAGEKRTISNTQDIETGCVNAGSQLFILTQNDSKVITITPSNTVATCSGSENETTTSGGGGGGGGGAAPAPAPAPAPTPTPAPTPADVVYVFKDGKFVPVSKEEAAKIDAGEQKPTPTPPAAEPKPATPTPPPAPVEPPPSPQAVNAARTAQVQAITRVEAPIVATVSSISNFVQTINAQTGLGLKRSESREENVITNILPRLNIDLSSLLSMLTVRMAVVAPVKNGTKKAAVDPLTLERIVAFITYGTPTTFKIGEGERAGVLNSFIAACGKIPQAEDEWSDLLKIASGRFPSGECDLTKDRASSNFKIVYKRDPKKDNPNDQAALTIMQYGLLPVKAVKAGDAAEIVPNRDVEKEKRAITAFRNIYGYDPKEATAWNVVRAIAYSGTQR